MIELHSFSSKLAPSAEAFDSLVLKIPFLSLQENRNLRNLPLAAQLFVSCHSEDTIGKLVKIERHHAGQEMIYLSLEGTQRVLERHQAFKTRGAPVVPTERIIVEFLAYSASLGNAVLIASELSTQEYE